MHRHGRDQKTTHEQGRGRRLLVALALNLGITIAEVVGGVISGSLALLADAAHNFSDAGSVLVSYIAFRISRREADRRRTFGYARAETVGALINLTVLAVISIYLLYEAVNRLLSPGEVAGMVMLVVGVIAMVEDLLAAWVLRKDLGGLNVRSTFLHMIADAMATVVVILGAVAVMIWGVNWIDPLLTIGLALFIMWHVRREMGEAIAVLMESAPERLDLDRLVAAVKDTGDVRDVHHLHVWQPAENRTAVELHVVTDVPDLEGATRLKERIRDRLRADFQIEHSTIEIECPGTGHDSSLVRQE